MANKGFFIHVKVELFEFKVSMYTGDFFNGSCCVIFYRFVAQNPTLRFPILTWKLLKNEGMIAPVFLESYIPIPLIGQAHVR